MQLPQRINNVILHLVSCSQHQYVILVIKVQVKTQSTLCLDIMSISNTVKSGQEEEEEEEEEKDDDDDNKK